MSNHRDKLTQAKRWVVKLGSSLLTNNGLGLRTDSMQNWVRQVVALRRNGCEGGRQTGLETPSPEHS